jgi:hypothetical protein
MPDGEDPKAEGDDPTPEDDANPEGEGAEGDGDDDPKPDGYLGEIHMPLAAPLSGDWIQNREAADGAQADDAKRIKEEEAEIRERTLSQLRAADAEGGKLEEGALPPLPNLSQLNKYTHASLQRAVRAVGGTRGKIERKAQLSGKEARRVKLMTEAGFLWLEGRTLVVHPRVAQFGTKYVLRYLSDDRSGWLDPIEALGRRSG